MEPKILFYDLEISPILGWVYEVWDANVIKVERPSYIMCFSYNWLGEKTIRNCAMPDYGLYDKDPYNDFAVVDELWRLMEKADIVVAHNATKFDNRIATARFIQHGFAPPAPYKTVDTLTAARKYARFASNSLANLCDQLEIGEKTKTKHGDVWYSCLNGDQKAWRKMKTYCNRDVKLLKELYQLLLPYIGSHPSVSIWLDSPDTCPRCGSTHMQHRGKTYTSVSAYKRIQCSDCGAWFRERLSDKEHTKPTFVPIR